MDSGPQVAFRARQCPEIFIGEYDEVCGYGWLTRKFREEKKSLMCGK